MNLIRIAVRIILITPLWCAVWVGETLSEHCDAAIEAIRQKLPVE